MAFAIEFFLRRLSQGLLIVLLVAFVIFTLLRIAPGDPIRIILGPMATATAMEETARELGLRDPIPVQFGRFVMQVAGGDFGHSFIRGKQGGASGGSQDGAMELSQRASVMDLIATALPYTLILAGLGLVFSFLIAVPIGLAAGLNPNGWQQKLGLYISSFFVSLPNIWVGVVLIYLLSAKSGLLPAIGYRNIAYAEGREIVGNREPIIPCILGFPNTAGGRGGINRQ